MTFESKMNQNYLSVLNDLFMIQKNFFLKFNKSSTLPIVAYTRRLQPCFQVFATGLLMLLVLAITDKRNMEPPKGMIPLVIGFVVTGLLTAFESNCGAALNPARDLGPRLFTALVGWKNVFW